MVHLKQFDLENQFEQEKPMLDEPWVTLTLDDEIVHYMVVADKIIITFKDSLIFGGEIISQKEYEKGDIIEIPEPIFHEGYRFIRWGYISEMANYSCVYIAQYEELPSIKLILNDSYTDTTAISLKAEKKGDIVSELTFNIDIPTDIAYISDNIIYFNKHYSGDINITCSAKDSNDIVYTDNKIIYVTCEVTDIIECNVVNVPSPIVESNKKSAIITYDCVVTTSKHDGSHETIIAQNEYVVNFQENTDTEDVIYTGKFNCMHGNEIEYTITQLGKTVDDTQHGDAMFKYIINGDDTSGRIKPIKDDVQSYSSEGAEFKRQTHDVIAYLVTSNNIKKVTFEGKINRTSVSDYEYFFSTSSDTASPLRGKNILWHNLSLFIYNRTDGKVGFGMTQSNQRDGYNNRDVMSSQYYDLADSEWHYYEVYYNENGYYCVTCDGINIQFSSTITEFKDNGITQKIIFVGNNWRGFAEDDTRALNGNVRNMNIYFENGECLELENDDTTESGTTESGTTESGTTESGTTESGTTESGTTESGTTESGTTESGTTESGTTESGTTESGTTESGTTESGTTESGTTESGTTESGTTVLNDELFKFNLGAHRGLLGYQENTLSAFNAAYDAGFRYMECDVQVSSSGIPYIKHDNTSQEPTNNSLLLVDLLNWAKEKNVVIEMDCAARTYINQAKAKIIYDLVHETNMQGSVIYTARYNELQYLINQNLYDIPVCVSMQTYTPTAINNVSSDVNNFSYVMVSYDSSQSNLREACEAAHNRGWKLKTWTVTSPEVAISNMNDGADVILVDATEYWNLVSEPEPTFEYVDLGLPSGLKWAKCNVGAANEYDYGKYFQWGDTVGYEGDEAKAHSTWATAPFNGGNTSYNAAAFNAVSGTACPNGVLALEYDAAHVNMGENWRMPTKEEFDELISGTNHSVETIGGKSGMKYSNKSDSSKYIFVPFAGYYTNGSLRYEGDKGYLWSSMLNDDGAGQLTCNSEGITITSYYRHYCGFSVRGVSE